MNHAGLLAAALSCLALFPFIGCAETSSDPAGQGGAMTSTGGALSTGGTTGVGTGGATAKGGSTSVGSGGATTSAGSSSVGNGGATATGGAATTGGATSVGNGGATATGGANVGGTTATGGTSPVATGGTSAAGATSTGGAVSSTGGAAPTAGATSFSPLCATLTTAVGVAPTKGGACTAADPQLCYKTCGPNSVGFKSETCTSSAYVEQTGCSFPPGDYSCYKVPTAMSTTCPTTVPRAGAACTVATCTPCNVAGNYEDSSGAPKAGWCVCSASGKWTCASTNAWPCPGNTGC